MNTNSFNNKHSLSKILKAGFVLVFCFGLVVLIMSAGDGKKTKTISGINIRFDEASPIHFIDKDEVINILKGISKSGLTNVPESAINLSAMEDAVNKNKWVSKAQLFIDNKGILNVDISLHQPVARIFPVDSASFYLIDDLGIAPLSKTQIANVPMFTGYAGRSTSLNRNDSATLQTIGVLSKFIAASPFWMSQIEQINIVASNDFELVPRLGNQTIRLGDTSNLQEKFDKLQLFYKQVSVPTSWSRYATLDLRFDNQIVATRKDAAQVYSDSMAVMRNMAKAVEDAKRQENIDNIQKTDPKSNDIISVEKSTERNVDMPDATDSSSMMKPQNKN